MNIQGVVRQLPLLEPLIDPDIDKKDRGAIKKSTSLVAQYDEDDNKTS